MERLINILKENKYQYFVKGIYKNGNFFEMPSYFKLNAVKVQTKQKFEKKLLKAFVPLNLTQIEKTKYETIYKFNENDFLIIEYVVDSHIIVSEFLLEDFKSNDTRLYYIDTVNDKIKKGSVRNFNTKFGHYSLKFEEYLNKNFENKMGNIKKKIEGFVIKKSNEVQFVDLFNDVKSFLNMSFFRNPRFIEEINKTALSSRLTYKGYDSEDVASFYNRFGTDILEGMSIYIFANRTEEGLLLSGEIFSNISIKENVHGLILPLHPKYGILIVPTEYYQQQNKIYSNKSYMVIDDVKTIRNINKRIYMDCKSLGIDVIGRKEDLENILLLK